ncbi:sulfotransferase [Candidatus Albibeggiatoa sp. nov. NOAA]|uniref:sulfotransferase n=1 Tax=Candidatus Albibeggiatoa sp. nov. NOAA TaxID=3162724 RepID=UPI003303460C|nr:sulfotransferase [Thiotrichaceae bacterium]
MLIHVGYHKTATTWLQLFYFPNHPELAFIAGHEGLWQHLMSAHSLEFNAQSTQQLFQPLIQQSLHTQQVPILSAERLSGNPHAGGFDNKDMADRLQAVFPQAKILIVIRHQPDAILSNYKQYIRVGGICNLTEYLTPPEDGRIPLFRLDNFAYHHLASYYAKLFGQDKVKVMLYEQFRQQPQAFIKELSQFIGVSSNQSFPTEQQVNTSMSDLGMVLKRQINKWHGNDSLYPITPCCAWLTTRLSKTVEYLDQKHYLDFYQSNLKQQVQNVIGHRFQQSNVQLAEQFQLDLAAYGYDLP